MIRAELRTFDPDTGETIDPTYMMNSKVIREGVAIVTPDGTYVVPLSHLEKAVRALREGAR